MPNKDAWIYSAPEPIRVTWRCDQDTKTEILKERGVLLNPHHCHIYSKYFTLLPHTYGRSIYNLTKPIMIEEPISSLISPFVAKILTNNVNCLDVYKRQVLVGIKGIEALVYLDDIIVFNPNIHSHADRLNSVFSRLKEANLRMQLEKCVFGSKEVEYLGHIVSSEGVKPDPKKVQAVKNYPVPKTV